MNLARHSITPTDPIHILDVRYDPDCQIFTVSTPSGFAVYRTWPLELVRKREVKGGTLGLVVPMHASSLLFLVGGGRSPRYPPNKVLLWDDVSGCEVAELEFRERVRGLACRRDWLAVALRRRVVLFKVGDQVSRHAEWDTCDNPRGLLALSTGAYSTLLVIPGRQLGHVQLIHLPPCTPPTPVGPPPDVPSQRPPPPPTKHPVSIIAAHTSALTTISVTPSGRLLATTSSKGTLVRTWDAFTGKLVREFRRGSDKAEIYGVAFRPDERELCVWSDKGTVHVFSIVGSGASNRQSTLSGLTPFIPLPKYFESEWSYAQYRIPVQSAHITLSSNSAAHTKNSDLADAERCIVGWVQVSPPSSETGSEAGSGLVEYQLVVLTFSGGWYRLSLPDSRSSASPTSANESSRAMHSASPPRTPLSPRHRTSSIASSVVAGASTITGSSGKGKEREKKESTSCVLQEYRKYGRWDGWA